jgi:hypothetical protein
MAPSGGRSVTSKKVLRKLEMESLGSKARSPVPMTEPIAFSQRTSTIRSFRQSTVGVNDESLQVTSIYPNPGINNLTVTSPEKMSSVVLYNLTGMEVYSQKISANTFTIQRNNMLSGIYLLRIDYESGRTATYKVIFR